MNKKENTSHCNKDKTNSEYHTQKFIARGSYSPHTTCICVCVFFFSGCIVCVLCFSCEAVQTLFFLSHCTDGINAFYFFIFILCADWYLADSKIWIDFVECEFRALFDYSRFFSFFLIIEIAVYYLICIVENEKNGWMWIPWKEYLIDVRKTTARKKKSRILFCSIQFSGFIASFGLCYLTSRKP